MFQRGRGGSPVVDAALGAASGLLASWVMDLAMRALSRVGGDETRRREQEAQRDLPPATVNAAETAARAVGRSLPEHRRKLGGEIVHYGYGALWGAAFALAARAVRASPPLASGVAFGAALWLVSDEILVPLFRLARPPTRYPASTHAKALAGHLVYGVATDASWRALRATIH